MLAVPKRRVAPERPEERLLERVLRGVASEQPDEVPEDLVAILGVEPLEGRNGHGVHHGL